MRNKLKMSILGSVIATAALAAVGCETQVELADHHGYVHHGYYDDHHDWHGGYYDEDRAYHEDAHDWHHD